MTDAREAAAEALYEALLAEQARRCSYGTTHGDGRTCDCKYRGWSPVVTSEMTGCPELRAALDVLKPPIDTSPAAPGPLIRQDPAEPRLPDPGRGMER